jgi:hypothetical protein
MPCIMNLKFQTCGYVTIFAGILKVQDFFISDVTFVMQPQGVLTTVICQG